MTPPDAPRNKFRAVKEHAGAGGFRPIHRLPGPVPGGRTAPAAMASACGAARQTGPQPRSTKHVLPHRPPILHKWLAKGGAGSRRFLAAAVPRATAVMSRSLPGSARRRCRGSWPTSASH